MAGASRLVRVSLVRARESHRGAVSELCLHCGPLGDGKRGIAFAKERDNTGGLRARSSLRLTTLG